MPTDNNIPITGHPGDAYTVRSFYESALDANGQPGHYQLMGLGFQNVGTTWDVATYENGYPVAITPASVVGGHVNNVAGGMTAVAGASAMMVYIASSTGLTVSAVVTNQIVGITNDPIWSNIAVYGTGGDAVSITGVVTGDGFFNIRAGETSGGIGVYGTGLTAVGVTGSVYVDSTGGDGLQVYGASGASSLGVTGTVALDHRQLIGISGGCTLNDKIEVRMPNGITSGYIGANLHTGISLGSWGLTSGIRIQAFSTGSTAEYVYVGGGTSFGLTAAGGAGMGYPLREFESVFLEVDNTHWVMIAADNSAAKIKFIGS
jgi:hypothetical protein